MDINHEFLTAARRRTVCEVTRKVWDIVLENREALGDETVMSIQCLLMEQIYMQKKIVQRLMDVKQGALLDELFVPNHDFDADSRRRKDPL